MAFIHGMGGSGEQYTETSLWTNQSPSSSFSAQTVTLSQGISNFKYIAIKFKAINTQSESDAVKMVVSVEDFNRLGGTANTPQMRISGLNSGPTSYSRSVLRASDTSITINGAYAANSSGSNNAYGIPLEILGLNELAQGTMVMDSGTFTGTNGSTATVTCGFQPSKVFVYAYVSDTNILSDVYDSSVNQKQICGWRTSSSSYGCSPYAMSSGTSGTIQSITSTGFTFKVGTVTTLNYVAIGSTTE